MKESLRICLRAVKLSQEVLLRHILPNSKLSEKQTINELLAILDNKELINAQSALKQELKPLEWEDLVL